MAKGQIMINGVGYANADVSVNALGRTIEGMRSFNWDRTWDKTHTKGRGGEDVERIRSGSTRTASMRITAKEAAAIRRALPPGKTLGDILPFPIVITVVNAENIPVVHTVKDVEFTGEAFAHEAEGGAIEEDLQLIIGDVITT